MNCARTGVPKAFCTCIECRPLVPPPEEPDPNDEVIYETPHVSDERLAELIAFTDAALCADDACRLVADLVPDAPSRAYPPSVRKMVEDDNKALRELKRLRDAASGAKP